MSAELKQFLIQLDLIGVKLPHTCWPNKYYVEGGILLRHSLGSKYYLNKPVCVRKEAYPYILKLILDNRRSCERQREGT